MVEILLSVVPFGDVKDNGDTILRASKLQLAGYGVGQYACSFTALLRTSRKTSNSSIMTTQTGNTSSLRWVGGWYETGCRGGGCHMTCLSGLSCELTFCKRCHESHSTITGWLSNDSVKGLDNQIIWYWISAFCLIIKEFDNQAQKLNYQINQYPKKSLIVSLEPLVKI